MISSGNFFLKRFINEATESFDNNFLGSKLHDNSSLEIQIPVFFIKIDKKSFSRLVKSISLSSLNNYCS